MNIKTGDTIIMLSGDDRGKTAKVIKAFPREGKVLVEGVNVIKRHEKSRREGQKGQIVERPMPVDVSNVAKASDVASARSPKKAAKPATKTAK